MGRKIIVAVLLAFVLVAIGTLVWRGLAPASGPAVVAAAPATPASGLVAFYFHGAKRCAACNSIERLTREALQQEVAAGQIEIRIVNVDEPANSHYVDDFQLAMRTVVLAIETGGKVSRWKRLDECWDLFGEPTDFTAYMQRSLADFRSAPPTGP